MTQPGLAVLTPFVGLPSETFVARHANELLPGRTLTVSTSMRPPEGSSTAWSPPAPSTVLAGRPPASGLRWLAARARAKAAGVPSGRWRWEPSTRDLGVLGDAFDACGVTVVLAEFLDVWIPLLPWLESRGVAVYGHAHGYDISTRLRHPWWRERYRAWDRADGVIAVSAVARERLVDLGIASERVHVVPCGVDVPDEPTRPIGRETVEVVAVGRFVPKKAPLATIAAFRRAAAVEPALRLTMIGDGPLLEPARAAARDDERVRLLGARPHDDALAAIGDADVFVQHSIVSEAGDEEGLPVGILEAMAAARPVVSTRHGGIPEAVDEGVTGLLVEEGDVDGMGDALVALARDPARRVAYGMAAHARASERFSWARERADLRALLGIDLVERV